MKGLTAFVDDALRQGLMTAVVTGREHAFHAGNGARLTILPIIRGALQDLETVTPALTAVL